MCHLRCENKDTHMRSTVVQKLGIESKRSRLSSRYIGCENNSMCRVRCENRDIHVRSMVV